MRTAELLQRQLRDARSGRVIFLSHCLLNENTRYLGGACRSCGVKEIIEDCLNRELGMVQMPCPEQQAWGGVLKRWLLLAYGAQRTWWRALRPLLLPLFVSFTKLIYRRMARATAAQIADYLRSGYTVAGVMGVDGSPSCGVTTTLDFEKTYALLARIDPATITLESMNAIIREGLVPGRGLFTAALQDELRRRQIHLPYLAHDLMAEINHTRIAMETKGVLTE